MSYIHISAPAYLEPPLCYLAAYFTGVFERAVKYWVNKYELIDAVCTDQLLYFIYDLLRLSQTDSPSAQKGIVAVNTVKSASSF